MVNTFILNIVLVNSTTYSKKAIVKFVEIWHNFFNYYNIVI